MAKTKVTTTKRSIENCFIEVRGKASYNLSFGKNNSNGEDDEGTVDSNVGATLSTAENNVSRASEIFTPDIAGLRGESLGDTDSSDENEIGKNQDTLEKENKEETGDDDDRSDYGAESFCSDGSYKGSEVTNVTSRSSLSGCSSLLQSTGINYDKRISDLIQSRTNRDRRRDDEDEEELSLLESEIKYLSEDGTLATERRQMTCGGRRNMSFTNDELRKIERENQLLLKKIMSHQKPQGRSNKPMSGPPRTSSSAINRKKQQKKIEEDNMMLLRRIQQAKPCAMPRVLAPGRRLATI